MRAMRSPPSPPSAPPSPRKALKLIKVDYEVLPHVTDVDEAMKPTAPVLHADMFTDGVEPKPKKASNIACRHEFGHGDVETGFKQADVIVERSFKTEATHQGYIEPHACLASVGPDGQGELWVCTQGHFMVRNTCAAPARHGRLEAAGHRVGDRRRLRRQDHGLHRAGRAGALAQGQPAGQGGDEPRRGVQGHRPHRLSTSIDVKIGVTKDGRITAADATCATRAAPSPARWSTWAP